MARSLVLIPLAVAIVSAQWPTWNTQTQPQQQNTGNFQPSNPSGNFQPQQGGFPNSIYPQQQSGSQQSQFPNFPPQFPGQQSGTGFANTNGGQGFAPYQPGQQQGLPPHITCPTEHEAAKTSCESETGCSRPQGGRGPPGGGFPRGPPGQSQNQGQSGQLPQFPSSNSQQTSGSFSQFPSTGGQTGSNGFPQFPFNSQNSGGRFSNYPRKTRQIPSGGQGGNSECRQKMCECMNTKLRNTCGTGFTPRNCSSNDRRPPPFFGQQGGQQSQSLPNTNQPGFPGLGSFQPYNQQGSSSQYQIPNTNYPQQGSFNTNNNGVQQSLPPYDPNQGFQTNWQNQNQNQQRFTQWTGEGRR